MTHGNMGKWEKQPGDEIAAGDVVCEVETDKAVSLASSHPCDVGHLLPERITVRASLNRVFFLFLPRVPLPMPQLFEGSACADLNASPQQFVE